jgi:hypothetical protein
MSVATPAKLDPALAAAIGRFSQACNYLERQLEFILTRLLPLTTDMGRVLFSGNQMRRNIEILSVMFLLPEVTLSDDLRTKLQSLIPRLVEINNDRSRFLHNPIGGGLGSPYYHILHKQDGKGSALVPVTSEMILQRAEEAEALWIELYIPPLEYDLSKWGAAFPSYPVKPYPKSQTPKPPRPKNQKRKGPPKPGGGNTTQ